MALPLPAEQSPSASLAEQAYLTLRDRLIMLDIRPGEPINDTALATELGVGRTPIREALKRLEVDRLVHTYPRRGTFATAVDITELADVSEIRQQLEPLAARRAALEATPEMREQLRSAAASISQLSEPLDQRELMRHDIAIHRLIYAAAGNPHLTDSLVRYDNLATRIWCLVVDKVPSVIEHVREHAALLEAIAEADAETASRLTLEHVTSFERAIRKAL